MELLGENPALDLFDPSWRIFSRNPNKPPHFVSDRATISNCIVSEGCYIYGTVKNSVLFPGVIVEEGAVVEDSIVMQETTIGTGTTVNKAIIDEEVTVGKNVVIGGQEKLTVVGARVVIDDDAQLEAGQRVNPNAHIKNVKGGVRA